MNILVVKPSSLGDVVHAFPAVHLIRTSAPDASVTWVVNDSYVELVELCPDVDDIALFARRRWGRLTRWPEFFKFTRDLRKRHFDLAIDFQGLFRSGLITFLSGAKRRIGFAHAREGATVFYSDKIPVPANVKHAIDKNLFLTASAMGVPVPEKSSFDDVLQRSHDGDKQSEILFRMHRLSSHEPLVAIAPAARWESKAFPPSLFAKVLDRVAETRPEARFWILGTEDERSVGEEVVEECHQCVPENLMGKANLVTLIEMLRKSDVALTNDTGPMHLSAAVGTPTVALFGPTDPDLTGPYGKEHVVLRGTCESGPCMQKKCNRKHDQRCGAQSVSVQQAADALVAKLKRQS